ncbi:MAG: VOC family protein [Pseudomonadota bacterium]
MTRLIHGLHHVTAISGDAQGNLDFYTRGLGLRLVKKTVNFDAPQVYHLYYGDGQGSPGSVMTFFPFPGARAGRVGRGQASITQFSVPPGSLDAWQARLADHRGRFVAREEVFGEERLVAADPEGLLIALVGRDDDRAPWQVGDVPSGQAIRGFAGVTMAVAAEAPIADILTGTFGYVRRAEMPLGAGRLVRYRQEGVAAGVVDLHIDPALAAGVEAAGTVHHVAFRVADRNAQAEIRDRLLAAGHSVTEAIDRDYFWAIYFRTDEGILFEVATDEPGFMVDEPLDSLGASLQLPRQHAHLREGLEASLPPLSP